MLCGLNLYSSQISANLGLLYPRPPKYKVTPTPPQIGLPKLAKWIFVGPNRTAPLQGTGMKKFPKAVDYKVYPKLQVLGPSFVKTGDKMRSRNENSTLEEKKEKGTKPLT
jgi:hypothetical protein